MLRKIICVFVFLILYSMPIYATTNVKSEHFIKIEDKYNLKFNILNNDSTDKENIYIIGAYASDGKMLCAKTEKINMVGNSKAFKNVDFDISEELSYAKIFAMSDIDNLKKDSIDKINLGEIRNYLWDFSESKFTSLGKITQTTTVDGLKLNYESKAVEITSDGKLYLFGGGTLTSCSATFNVKGECYIKIVAESTDKSTPRTLKIVNKNGNTLKETEISKKNENVLHYNGEAGDISVFSKSSGIYIHSIEVSYMDDENMNYANFYTDSWQKLKILCDKVPNGSTIYLQNDYFKCNTPLFLSRENANITITAAKNYNPILDFSYYGEQFLNTKEGVKNRGILITGSAYTLKGFVVEKAPGIGIYLCGENACDNKIESIVSRYNSGSGFFIAYGASNNIMKYCDAYRNCDVYTKGENADGFSISIQAGTGNVLENCRSFDNADDGYDNFANHNDVKYIDCFCWNNGNSEVFTGKYDYDNGYEIDINSPLMRIMISQSKSFGENVRNNKIILPKDCIINVLPNETTSDGAIIPEIFAYAEWDGNGNGFKLGSGYSELHGEAVGSESYRLLENCITFKHPNKGFDRNNCTAKMELKNILSFDNEKNYWCDKINVLKCENIVGFGGIKKDTTDENIVIAQPNSDKQIEIRKIIYAKINNHINSLRNNKTIGKLNLYDF